MQKIRCVVERITYQNPENGYSVLKCRVKDYSELVPVIGNMIDANVGSVLLCDGSWKVDAKYGKEHQMMEYMVQNLVEMLTEGAGIEYDDAMHTIYDSDIYEKLMDAETGLYRESPSYVYGLLQDEINFGHIVQAEV